MQCACALYSSVASPAVQYFITLSHKQHDFRRNGTDTQNVCFDLSAIFFSKTFLILREIQRDIIKNVHRSLREVSVILAVYLTL